MVQLKASSDEPACLDLSSALALVTTLPPPQTVRCKEYVSRQSLSLLHGGPLSSLPPLPSMKRKGGRLSALRASLAGHLSRVQEATDGILKDLGLIKEEEQVSEEGNEAAPQWYEDEAYSVEAMAPYNPLQSGAFAAIIPGDSVAEMVATSSVLNFLNIYNTLLIGRLVLTWFPNPPEVIANPLSTICDPYLNLFRGIIPPIGGTIDLSPVLAFLALNVFTNAATALPAELPPNTNEPVYRAPASSEEEAIMTGKPMGTVVKKKALSAKRGFWKARN